MAARPNERQHPCHAKNGVRNREVPDLLCRVSRYNIGIKPLFRQTGSLLSNAPKTVLLNTAGGYSNSLQIDSGILLIPFRPVNNISYKNLNLGGHPYERIMESGREYQDLQTDCESARALPKGFCHAAAKTRHPDSVDWRQSDHYDYFVRFLLVLVGGELDSTGVKRQ